MEQWKRGWFWDHPIWICDREKRGRNWLEQHYDVLLFNSHRALMRSLSQDLSVLGTSLPVTAVKRQDHSRPIAGLDWKGIVTCSPTTSRIDSFQRKDYRTRLVNPYGRVILRFLFFGFLPFQGFELKISSSTGFVFSPKTPWLVRPSREPCSRK